MKNIVEKTEQAERFEKDHGYDSAGKFNLVLATLQDFQGQALAE